ncbi:MAG TPA: TetR/AcrR family transcriptional regulator [Bryobacteraceae bacterium]|nr:TetR/AcrR family transcriptional regulator [Bryobacteraceae bacterium]
MSDTKQKLLDTAERLIASQGFAATSLRQIIAEAGVNLASVHYHFGSKEELLDHVIARKVTAVNEERIEQLNALEREAGSAPVAVDKILDAFLSPMIQLAEQNPQFVQLMGRMQGEGLLQSIVAKHFQPTVAYFLKALRRSLDQLSDGELHWRAQFMFGAMSRAMSASGGLATQGIQGDTPDFACLIRRLHAFLSAGFLAPATEEARITAEVKQ